MKYFERFKKFKLSNILTLVGMFIVDALGFYISISFSVKISQGKTLFGDSNSFDNSVETAVSKADISVLVMYWILTAVLFVIFIYYMFFKKVEDDKPVEKDIVNGKTVIIESKDCERKDEETEIDIDRLKEREEEINKDE